MTDDPFSLSHTETLSPALPVHETLRASALAANSLSEATLRSYDACWRRFTGWCGDRDVPCLPADPVTVAGWIGECGLSLSSIRVTLAAIGLRPQVGAHGESHYAPRCAGHAARTGTGAGRRPSVRSRPLRLTALRRMLDEIPA